MPRGTLNPAGRPSPWKSFWRVLFGNLLLASLLWGLGLAAFLAFTLHMDNDFARYAREHQRWAALLANLKTGPGYLLLALLYTLAGYPLLRRLPSEGGASRLGRLARWSGCLILTNLLLFILSLGLAALGNPSFLDALSRILSKTFPNISLYWIHRWHLLPVMAGLFILLLIHDLLAYRRLFLGRHPGSRRRLAFDLPLGLLLLGGILGAMRHTAPPEAFKDPARPNIFILASDSLRPDHLHCYGYKRKTSPNIDRLAEDSVLLENLQVATASTLESWLTILSSRFPTVHGIRYMFPSKERVERAAAIPDTLPRILNNQGYHTAVSSNWAGNCFRLVDMGFRANRASDIQNFDVFLAEAALMAHLVFPIYFNNRLGEWLYPEVRQITSYINPDALLDRFQEELDRAQQARKPFFGVLFTSQTHLPYAASYPFNLKWADPGYRGPNRFEIDFEVDNFIQHGFRDDLTPVQVQHILDLYDGAVSEFDNTVGRVLDLLRRRGLLDTSIILVTSDHGDDLYDPGTTLGHGTNFFGGDQNTAIPFILHLPGRQFAGTRVGQIARTVDVAPTLLGCAGLSVPPDHEGVDLRPAFRHPERSLDLPAFAETCYLFYRKQRMEPQAKSVAPADKTLFIDPGFHNNFVLKEKYHQPVIDTKDRMIRTGRWKLIWIPGKQGPLLRLYDMQADPHQQHDLSGLKLPVMARLFKTLQRYWAGETDLRWSPKEDAQRLP